MDINKLKEIADVYAAKFTPNKEHCVAEVLTERMLCILNSIIMGAEGVEKYQKAILNYDDRYQDAVTDLSRFQDAVDKLSVTDEVRTEIAHTLRDNVIRLKNAIENIQHNRGLSVGYLENTQKNIDIGVRQFYDLKSAIDAIEGL